MGQLGFFLLDDSGSCSGTVGVIVSDSLVAGIEWALVRLREDVWAPKLDIAVTSCGIFSIVATATAMADETIHFTSFHHVLVHLLWW